MNDRPKMNTPAGEAPQGANFWTTCREAVRSVPTPEHAAEMGQEAFSERAATESKMEETHEREPI